MRSKAIFMALLALAFGAQAASVSQEEAVLAARGWVADGGALGTYIGQGVESAATHVTTNGATFYSVKMWGGGTLFLSSDTEMEPVIAFAGTLRDFSEMDRESPLWALLNKDVSARRAELDSTPVVMLPKSSSGTGAGSEQPVSETAAAWAKLIALGEELSRLKFAKSASWLSAPPGDLCVPALLESEWDQSVAGGDDDVPEPLACYNYYTPKDATGVIDGGYVGNAVCGCVATAMSQIMFYHKYPEAATVPTTPDTCWFDKTELTLPVSGDPYDWNAMAAAPAEDEPEGARKAIGQLTADAGRSVGMHYTLKDSGSYTFKASKSMVDVFKYSQSVYADQNRVGELTLKQTLGKTILSNLDAGYPVMLGIEGRSGGHEIVADGYGYQDGKMFVHLNMGWSGVANVWYNLPDIDTRPNAGHVFDVIDDVAYNIIPDGAGLGVMSGRVLDEFGVGLNAATVTVYVAGSDTVVTQLLTSQYGVWGVTLPEGEYGVRTQDATGERKGAIDGIALRVPVQKDIDLSWRSPNGSVENGKYPGVTKAGDLGNSWGNDIELLYPRIMIVDAGGKTNLFTTLDKAIEGARAIAAGGETPVMEILRAVNFNDDAEIDFPCEIRAATGELSSTAVSRPDGAAITVVAGGELVLSNCVFESTGSVPLVAEAGGRIFVGPGFSAERVATADVDGFNVIGYVDSDIAVECTAATAAGDVFGKAVTGDSAALAGSAARLYATFSEDATVRGTIELVTEGVYRLVWAGVPVPIGSAVGYFVLADGTTNTYAMVNALFDGFANALEAGRLGPAPEIVVVGSDPAGLNRDIVVDGVSLTIRGEGGASVTPAADAHIIVTGGGSLTMRDISFGGRTGDTFVRISDGGSMTLGAGATLTSLECSANYAPLTSAGPVAVMSGGTLRLEAGSSIVGCSATGASTKGGGVYVYVGGTLELAGGSVTGCQAVKQRGGGVYAESGANVVVSGASVVSNNVETGSKASDIFFNNLSDKIIVTNSAAGGSIGVRYSNGTGNGEGFVFADASALSSAHDIDASAEAFFNDASAERVAAADGTDIKWVAAAAAGGLTPIDQSDPAAMALAVAKVDYPSGYTPYGSTAYWGSVQEAFESLEEASGAATVTLLQDDWFVEDIVVNCSVTLKSDAAVPNTLERRGDCSICVAEGASLTIRDVDCSDIALFVAYGVYLEKPFISVDGGELDVDGATISGVAAGDRGAAITAFGGAQVVLRGGAMVYNCTNAYEYVADRTAYAAALLADGEGTTVVLEDCMVSGCTAYRVGGVCVINGAEVEVSGAATVYGNSMSDGEDANMAVAASSSLVLTDTLTGRIGLRREISADRVVFGSVADSFSGSDADLVSSAMNFISDDTGSYGVAVRASSGKTLLVWFDRLGDDDTYTDSEDVVYTLVKSSAVPFPVEPPVGEAGLFYTGEEQTGVLPGRGYALSGVVAATDAGSYTATATLASGYVWSDGTTAAKAVVWTISKAELDLSGITFEDAVYFYDGTPKSIAISGELPEGVTVAYSGNDWTQPGAYVVTATFTVEDGSYESIDDMTATLYIRRAVDKPAALPLVYNAAEQVGVAAGDYYSLSGDFTGKDAGTNYTAVASLDDYCAWSDGSTNDFEIVWSISPAPLTITASDAWKLLGAADPAAFAYTVDGLQGGDTVGDVLTGGLSRIPGEALGVYKITQGDLDVAPDNPNYYIAEFNLGNFSILETEPVTSRLPAIADAAAVVAALDGSNIADPAVAAAIAGAADPLAAYTGFRNWALGVTGGVDAACDSSHAWVSYEFGVTDVFENEPAVTFTSMAVEDPSTATMKVTLVVMDGGAEKAVTPASVAKLFEMSADLVTWTADVTATPNGDGSYTVQPTDTTLQAAFIRLAY